MQHLCMLIWLSPKNTARDPPKGPISIKGFRLHEELGLWVSKPEGPTRSTAFQQYFMQKNDTGSFGRSPKNTKFFKGHARKKHHKASK